MDNLNSFDHPIPNETAATLTPEKLAALKRVFDLICQEYKIPLAAKSERNYLAHKILTAATTIEHEPLLLIFARNAVARYRR